jgi:hypothetical protein
MEELRSIISKNADNDTDDWPIKESTYLRKVISEVEDMEMQIDKITGFIKQV